MQRFRPYNRWPPVPQGQSFILSQETPRPQPLPYDSRRQPDIQQFARIRALARPGHVVQLGHDDKRPNDPNVPKARFANRSQKIVAANVPQLILPQNLQRSTLLIGNTTGVMVLVSLGAPPAAGVGIPINNNSRFEMTGLSVATDDIYVTCGNAGVIVSAYEGVASYSSSHI